MENKTNNQLSIHILPTSSGLLGICFVILSFIIVEDKTQITVIDDLILIPITAFFLASILSYFSIRQSARSQAGVKLEKWADIIFIAGIFFLMAFSIALGFKFAA